MSARQEIYKQADWAWTYPILYLRAPDAVLFQPVSSEIPTSVRAEEPNLSD